MEIFALGMIALMLACCKNALWEIRDQLKTRNELAKSANTQKETELALRREELRILRGDFTHSSNDQS